MLSRIVSFVFLAVGIVCGLLTTRITDVMMWLVGALYSGFVAANVLKWYWWRFNGYGYFWGMVAGIGGAMVLLLIAEKIDRPQLQRALHLPASCCSSRSSVASPARC